MTAKCEKVGFWVILLLAFFSRLWNLQELPLGLNQDEAFSGYEAWNLLKTGRDSWLNPFPVYFTAWGSGMNVLYSCLLVPFMALLGTSVWVIRLPQALLGVLSCYLFYRLISLMYGKRAGLIGFFMITICPWHIMLSRWGLESNVVVFFLLAGFYFFACGINNLRYLYVSALFYGLGMYAYAVCVPFIVVVFGGQLLYFLSWKFNRQTLLAVLIAGEIFALIAVPLGLLFLVNQDIIGEIRTSYFSVPKLVYWRGGEIGFADFNVKLAVLRWILIAGDDGMITNRMMPFGMFYPLSIWFIFIGLGLLIRRAVEEKKKRQFMISACVIGQIIGGLIFAVMLYPCINRLNFLWLNFLIALVAFILVLPRKVTLIVLGVYGVGFLWFIYAYVTRYNQEAVNNFTPDMAQALLMAEKYHQQSGLPIVILEQPASFSKVLYYTKLANIEWQSTVQWWNYPESYLEAKSFGHYIFQPQWDYVKMPMQAVYIAPAKRNYYFYQFAVNSLGQLIVAVPR